MDKQKLPKPTIEDLIDKGNSDIQKLFNNLRLNIKKINQNIKEYSTSRYIGYKLVKNKTLFAEVHIRKEKIEFHLRPIDYFASKLIIKKAPDSHRWTLNKLVDISHESDLNSMMNLVEQSYKNVL